MQLFVSGSAGVETAARTAIILVFLISSLICLRIVNSRQNRAEKLVRKNAYLTPQQFFREKHDSCGKKRKTKKDGEFEGVYILYNTSRNKYYVGQSVHVFSRVNAHLTGHGNGDVYADYKYGDDFKIMLVPLCNSGYGNLNDLEREMIGAFDSCATGYNKTRGNR